MRYEGSAYSATRVVWPYDSCPVVEPDPRGIASKASKVVQMYMLGTFLMRMDICKLQQGLGDVGNKKKACKSH